MLSTQDRSEMDRGSGSKALFIPWIGKRRKFTLKLIDKKIMPCTYLEPFKVLSLLCSLIGHTQMMIVTAGFQSNIVIFLVNVWLLQA